MKPSALSGMHPLGVGTRRGACGDRKEPKSRDTPLGVLGGSWMVLPSWHMWIGVERRKMEKRSEIGYEKTKSPNANKMLQRAITSLTPALRVLCEFGYVFM
jgi:hypothetical protein